MARTFDQHIDSNSLKQSAVTSDHDRRKIAIVGTGISGLSAAWALHKTCDITLYEANDRIGGHTNTVKVKSTDGVVPVDTGFIVYNEPNYRNLTALFNLLGVASNETEMHFSVSARDRDIEYASSGLSGMFADRRKIASPKFLGMIKDIFRFYSQAKTMAASADEHSLGEYLHINNYGKTFIEDHILPMAAAIWSCPVSTILQFPATSFARFFVNHGLVEFGTPFMWRSVDGGSDQYIEPLTQGFAGRIKLNTAISKVYRTSAGVILQTVNAEEKHFDDVILACHAPQSFEILADASEEESRILSTFKTQPNRAVLHRDPAFMPRRRRAWASWNYLSEQAGTDELSVTYWMNELQELRIQTDYFVTLNPSFEPKTNSIIAEFDYAHPVFDTAATKAQRDIWEIQGKNNVWYAGAWLGYGFHEDGLQAGLAVAEAMSEWRRPWNFDFSRERLNRPLPTPEQNAVAA